MPLPLKISIPWTLTEEGQEGIYYFCLLCHQDSHEVEEAGKDDGKKHKEN